MKASLVKVILEFSLAVFISFIFLNCSGARYLTPDEINKDQSLTVHLANGTVQEGVIIERTGDVIKMISTNDHEMHSLNVGEIRKVEPSPNQYDYNAYPISPAEIKKHKTSRNTWVYAAGGGAFGAIVGLAVGYPIWLANDNPPPLFAGGIGLVVSSIYFGTRGLKKDKETALQEVRYMRVQKSQFASEKQAEEKRIQAINEEKAKVQKMLEKKKKKDNTNNL